MMEDACAKENGKDAARPVPSKPPLPSLVCATCAGQKILVPLSMSEQSDSDATLDIAFSWEHMVDAEALMNSLAKALSHFPCCTGRFVRRQVFVEPAAGVKVKQPRLCILCNNAGVSFSHSRYDGKRPSVLGPITGLFDRAVGTLAKADAKGGPLLRVKLLECEDGQILALSFSQGLADVEGIGFFLQAWCHTHRGEEPGPASLDARVVLEGAVNNGFPKLDSAFTYLHRRELATRAATAKAAAAAAAERLGVTTFLLDWDELRTLADDFSQKLRGRRLIYDSETLSHAEVAFALVVEALGKAVSASVWLDYRVTFGFDRLFGHVRGIADVDLPADHIQAAAVIRKKLQIAKDSPDFWCWKAQQSKTCPVEPSAEIIFSSWLEAANRRQVGWVGGHMLLWQSTVNARTRAGRKNFVVVPELSSYEVAQLKLNAVYRMSHASHVLHTGLPDGMSTPLEALEDLDCVELEDKDVQQQSLIRRATTRQLHRAQDAKPFVPAAVLAVVIGVCSVVPYNMVLRGDPGSPLFISFCLHLAIIGGSLHRAKSLIMERSIPLRYHAAIILLGCSFTSFKSDAYVRLPASVCMMLSNLRMMVGVVVQYVLFRKRYSLSQLFGVLIVTVGIAWASQAMQSASAARSTAASAGAASSHDFGVGCAEVLVSSVSLALLSSTVKIAFEKFGESVEEQIFMQHLCGIFIVFPSQWDKVGPRIVDWYQRPDWWLILNLLLSVASTFAARAAA
ncbi:Efr, partial [Symbiodinium necroappetens]